MSLIQLLQEVMLFSGLSPEELQSIADLCQSRVLSKGEVLAEQGAPGEEFYIVTKGFVEISIAAGPQASSVIVNLGRGQIIGEMSMVDRGPRSATVRAISDETVVQVISQSRFAALCEQNTQIGFKVMRDIAADLSFKLRQRNLNLG